MPLKDISIKSHIRNYNVIFCSASSLSETITNTKPSFLLIDNNVWNLYQDTLLKDIHHDKLILDIKEDNKNLDYVTKLYNSILSKTPKKNITVISIGGGITQDLSGFFASTLYRGVKWIYIPTTLLAQADSCIGAKTSLNYMSYKNLIGTFYPPHEVYITTNFLKTLKPEDYLSGVGEIAKLHLIGGFESTEYFKNNLQSIINQDSNNLQNIITNTLLIKKDYIENDEFDMGRRNILNFGHCFGHAIESTTEFSIPHGSAVVIGIILANIVSYGRNLLSEKTMKDVEDSILHPLIKHIKFKSLNIDVNSIIEGMKKDKKRTGEGIPLIIMKNNYMMEKVSDLSPAEIHNALDFYISRK